MKRAMAEAIDKMGGLDILINNGGVRAFSSQRMSRTACTRKTPAHAISQNSVRVTALLRSGDHGGDAWQRRGGLPGSNQAARDRYSTHLLLGMSIRKI